MLRKRAPSASAQSLLAAMAAEPKSWRYGYDLSIETGLPSGTLYPILMRLASRGWMETAWEDAPPPGRPPRHLYRLTPDGLRQARELTAPKSRAAAVKLRAQTGEAS